MRNSALVILLLTACQLSARDLVSESSRSASEAWVSRRFASTQELAAVESALGPRLALIEGQTNNWRQAWTWGNHAEAGYLAAAAWQSWLSTNTYVKTELDPAALSALAAFAATNKTKVVHSSVSSNVWATLGVGGTVTVHTVVAAQVTDYDRLVVTDPNGSFSGIYSKQDGGLHWYAEDWRRISIMPGYVGTILWTSGDTEAYGGDDTTPPFEFQEALNGFPLPIPTTAFALKDGYTTNSVPYVLTTGNVWQAVATVQQTAEDALLAADQAGTLINYHTALDAAPHAGKFVTPGQMTNNTSHVLSQWYAADGSLTQQIVRVGAEIWTNRWTAGLAVAITNGMLGPIRVTANDGSGFLVSGTGRAGGTDDSGGAVIGLSYNATDNKQLWFGAGRCVDGVMSYFTGVRFNGAGVDGWSLENNTTAQLTVGGYDYDLIVPVGVQTQRLRMWDYGTSAYRYMILSNGVFVLQ